MNNAQRTAASTALARQAAARAQENLDQRLTNVAKAGNLGKVMDCLGQGANLRYNEDITLCEAASHGQDEVVSLLLNRGANIHARGDLPLRWAAQRGCAGTVALLVERGADVNAVGDGRTPCALVAATIHGSLETVKRLVEGGAHVQAGDDAALRIAARWGYDEIVGYLLDQGADIHA